VTTRGAGTLRDLDKLKALYTVPLDDFVGEVMIPALQAAHSVDCMMGFFNSTAFVALAPGLAAFLNRPAGVLRVIASPAVSRDDEEAMRQAVENPVDVLTRAAERLFVETEMSESALIQHQYDCLAYMLAAGRLEMKFSWVAGGTFHPKVWAFSDDVDTVVLHGSSNFTSHGLVSNLETVALERPWRGAEQTERTNTLCTLFEHLWRGETRDATTIPLSEAIRERLLRRAEGASHPSLDAFMALYHSGNIAKSVVRRLREPDGIAIGTGNFAHQAAAIKAWLDNGKRGILSMATGSGKTLTALAAAKEIDVPSLLIIIAAPYRPLLSQWESEVHRFGITPLNLSRLSVPEKVHRLSLEQRALAGSPGCSVAVVTHSTLSSSAMASLFRAPQFGVNALLIADEVHNLGRQSFVGGERLEGFAYRMGLSATPERQFDPEGSLALRDFFGGVVYEFPLEKAIGTCLVPYNYHLIPVSLNRREVDLYEELTERLQRMGYRDEALDPGDSGRLSLAITKLLVQRRAIVESCEEKIPQLAGRLFPSSSPLRHVLIYASDKRPLQLREVNRLLRERGVFFHQLTSTESCDRRLTESLLAAFASGQLQVLTSKRVLDEGVNIPEVCTAYLLASSTVRRQWIQRRGRLLRECPAIGKRWAEMYDFIVVAEGVPVSIREQELVRARAFATLARNCGDPSGPFAVIDQYSS
jgi:superfamily II DNA or RNA helicase